MNNIICPVNNNGLIDIDYCEEIMKQTKGKKLLCAMHINNETGIIQPIEQISELCRRHEALFDPDFYCDLESFLFEFVNDISAQGMKKIIQEIYPMA